MKRKYKAIDLFCGVGGLTHGLIRSGIDVLAGVDSDSTCRYAYEANNDSVFVNKEIQNLTRKDIYNIFNSKNIDIMAGCAPCQPFSRHTQKNKFRKDDEKWGLLYHFANLIKQVKPKIVTMENVPQITTQKVFNDFISLLKQTGYSISWTKVFSPDYGIPQKRTRLVLLASLLGPIKLIPPTHTKSKYKTVYDSINKLPPIKAGQICSSDKLHRAASLSAVNCERIKASKPGGTWADWNEDLIAGCHKKKSGASYSAVYSRMKWDEPAPTITTQFYSFGTGRFGHPEQDRALSLREGALLQTFPRGYKFWKADNRPSYKQIGTHIGNAVPVKLAEIIGKSILIHMEGQNDKWIRREQILI